MQDLRRSDFGPGGHEIGYADIPGPVCFTAVCYMCNYPMMAILLHGVDEDKRYVQCGKCFRWSAFDDPNLFLQMTFTGREDD